MSSDCNAAGTFSFVISTKFILDFTKADSLQQFLLAATANTNLLSVQHSEDDLYYEHAHMFFYSKHKNKNKKEIEKELQKTNLINDPTCPLFQSFVNAVTHEVTTTSLIDLGRCILNQNIIHLVPLKFKLHSCPVFQHLAQISEEKRFSTANCMDYQTSMTQTTTTDLNVLAKAPKHNLVKQPISPLQYLANANKPKMQHFQ